jgi:hypothetical protein
MADEYVITGGRLLRVDGPSDVPSLRTVGGTEGACSTTHSAQHKQGGSDSIKLDDLAVPDDNTDLNSTTASHGLLPKLGGGSSNFLRADGAWASPGAASTNIKEVEIDFGTTSSHGATFLVTDADVAADSQIMAFQSYQAPTSRDRDENEMDQVHVIAYPVTASTMSLRVAGLIGRVHGKFKINYLIG